MATDFPTFIDQLRIVQEPRGLLGRYFLAFESEAATAGLTFRLAPFAEFTATYIRTKASWPPTLSPVIDARETDIDEGPSACMIGYDRNNEPAVTHAIRLMDFRGKSLKTAFEDLSFWYGSRGVERQRDCKCSSWAPSAEKITGKILYIGAFWVRPDLRGGRVGPIVQDLARNYGTSQFEYDYIATVGMHTWDRPELKTRYAFEGVEDGFSLSRPGQPDWHGRIMWSSQGAELLRLQATVERIELDRGMLKSTGNEELPLKRSGS